MSIKKLGLVAAACVAVFAVVPVASASAEPTFVGACYIEGTATFAPKTKLPTKLPEKDGYKFTSSPVTVCAHLSEEQANELAAAAKTLSPEEFAAAVKKVVGETGEITAEAAVESKEESEYGELSCAASAGGFEAALAPAFPASGKPGKGHLTVAKHTVKFKFRFIGTGTDVHFQAGEESGATFTAAGEATFAEDIKAVQECSEEGPSALKFKAAAAGVI
jgi:hypothetical protein